MTNDKGIDELTSTVNSLAYGLGSVFWVVGLGLWQLRQPVKLLITVTALLAGVVAGFFSPSYRWLLLAAPPLVAVGVFGVIRKGEIEFYRQAFLDVGFKGRDSKAPYLISKRDLGNHRTGLFFRSNISLQEWKKRLPDLQTALDCTILSQKKARAKRLSTSFPSPQA